MADTNGWIADLAGQVAQDVYAMDAALADGVLRMAPVVQSELLSDPALDENVKKYLREAPVLELLSGYRGPAGRPPAKLLLKGHKAKLADTPIAQTCIDSNGALITRDTGFKVVANHGPRLF